MDRREITSEEMRAYSLHIQRTGAPRNALKTVQCLFEIGGHAGFDVGSGVG